MNRATRAFTLVEIMLAMIIISFGLVVLIGSIIQSFGIIRAARDFEHARRVLALVEERHPLQLDELEEGSESGSFDEIEGFTWEREIALQGLEEDQLFRIVIKVTWDDRGEETVEQIETLLHLPTARGLGFIHENAVTE